MERESTVEELNNRITLLKTTLEYYADMSIYGGNINKMNILKDKGHQARFALDQIKTLDNYDDEIINNLKEALESNPNISKDEMVEALENMQKITKSINLIKDNE